MDQFNEDILTQGLASLPREGQIAFALSACERLYPNYVAFARESGWGDPAALRTGLDVAWSYLDGLSVSQRSFREAHDRVQSAEPETEDFDTIRVSSALDAATSVGLLLAFLEEGGVEKIVQIGALCRDTVDMYVQEALALDPADPHVEERILNHDLMQAELRRQHDDLSMLRSLGSDLKMIAQLRSQWRAPPRGNIE